MMNKDEEMMNGERRMMNKRDGERLGLQFIINRSSFFRLCAGICKGIRF